MIRKYIHLLLLIILHFSCTKYIEYSPPYEGDKIVINGYFSPNKGTRIKITHSINPVGKYFWSDSLLVKDASATVYENGIKLIDLEYQGEGFYGLSNSTKTELMAGHQYKLIVQSEQYGIAESDEITIPEQPQIKDFKFKKIGEVYGSGSVNGLFSFSISEPNEKETCFSIEVISHDNETFYCQPYPRIESEYYFESCTASVFNLRFYNNACGFTNRLHQYSFGLASDENGQIFPDYKSLTIKIGTVSLDMYDYAKSYNELEGMALGFAEPPILKSNINGGYGLLYGSNIISYPIKLP
jgi:hypothetical protein